MAVDLLQLLAKFKEINDSEFETIIYKTHVPSVAPQAYLNVIFRPAPQALREARVRQLRMPQALAEFYAAHNGAGLLSGTIRIFGILPDTYQIQRTDWFRKRIPHDILDVYREYSRHLEVRDQVCFADYSYDKSAVCIGRGSGQITCYFDEDFARIRQTWPSFEEWITSEIARLSFCFDEQGNRLVAEELLLPGLEPGPAN